MELEAMLCDAATVREGLLHLLGAGITQLNREAYPAPMGVQLALLLHAKQEEMGKNHRLTVVLWGDAKLAEMSVDFQVSPGQGGRTAAVTSVPIVASLQAQNLPKEGTYSLEINIDGKVEKTLYLHALLSQRAPAAQG